MSVESKPNKLVKGLVLDTFHTDVDNTVATYALNSQLEDQEGNHFHYGSEVGTTYIKEIPTNHVVIGHINMERNETVLFTTDGTNSTIGILSRKDDMSYEYEIKVDDTKQAKKLNFKKDTYIRGVYRLLNGCDKVIYFVDGINKDRRININKLDSYKTSDTASVASGIIFDDSLRATIYALSSATGNIQLIRLLSASPEATANVLANLSSGAELTKLLTASANGMGTAFANLIRTANIVSSIEATGTSTVNVDIVRLLESNVSAIGSVNAILQSSQQGIVEIDVTLTGVASSTAILLRSALLEVNLTTEASTVTTAILTRIISAQSQALADTSATAQITIPVNATANATATTAADAILSYAVNATANAIANTEATSQLSKVITASVDAVANSSSEALIGLVLVSTTTANGSVSTADLYINRLLTSSVTAQGTTTAEALIAKLLQSSLTSTATATSDALVSKLATSSITAQAITTADSLISKLLTSTVNSTGNVTANLQLADLLSTALSGTATTEAVLEAINLLIGDPYIDNVSLLLQGDDNPSGVTQNNTFKDSSTNDFPITRNGNVTQGTFSPFDRALTNSGGSAYFDGTSDYLSVLNNILLNLEASNFTIEFWWYPVTIPSSISAIASKRSTGGFEGFLIYFNTSSLAPICLSTVNGTSWNVSITSSISCTLNQWNHIAFTRNSNTWTVWVNGQSGATTTVSGTIPTNTGALTIGADGNNSLYYLNQSYLSNFRIVKGTAVYTSNFNPSTIPLTAITNTSLLLNFTNAAIFDGVKLNNVETVGNVQINTSIKKYGTGSLAFDGNGDYLSVADNNAWHFGSDNFTVEAWVYITSSAVQQTIVGQWDGVGGGTGLSWLLVTSNDSNRYLRFLISSNGSSVVFDLISTSSIPLNQWSHVAIVRNGNVFQLYLNGIAATGGSTTNSATLFNSPNILTVGATSNNTQHWNGYIDDLRITKGIARYTSNFNTNLPAKLSSLIPNYLVSRSLRFNSADSTYLNRTPTVAGNRTTWTWSGWIKCGNLLGNQTLFSSSNESTTQFYLMLSNNSLGVLDYINSTQLNINTTQVFRDSSAWYHVIVSIDTPQAISSNRVKIYINGQQVTNFSIPNYPIQNYQGTINTTVSHSIGREEYANNQWFNGYITEVNFIDGLALTPDSFGERDTNTGVWRPKEYTGTYGTNGFHLNFSDITQLGKDYSGNNNNWTPSGFSVTPGVGYDSLTDVPTPNGTDNGFGGEVRGNYATLNPMSNPNTPLYTISNGNLDYSCSALSGAAGRMSVTSTIPLGVGKYYWEVIPTTTNPSFGILAFRSQGIDVNAASPGTGYYIAVFNAGQNSTITGPVYSGTSFSFNVNDVIGIAFDGVLGELSFYKNGTYIGKYLNIPLTEMWLPGTGVSTGGASTSYSINFGQRPFVYQAPSGFKALNTANLPTPAIGGGGESNLANKYMDITTYTGTGAAQSIFNSGFKPDFVWIKSRSAATSHAIYDISRGVQKRLSSDLTNAQVIDTTGLSSFDNTGFSIGALADINTSGATYIAWQWRAGGTPVTNNGGATSSQVSVSQISGFSVVSYTGTSSATTIGHGLGVAPKMIIIKNVNNIATWAIYHDSLGSGSPQTYYLDFSNNLQSSSTAYWNSIKPTVNNFSIGFGSSSVNSSGNPFIAYCFAEIEGYSKFSSYLGNNSTDGTFVYTGFKPKYILIKCITAAANWVLYNSIVNTGNPVVNELFANTTAAENSVANDDIDFLSNGFKLRSTNAAINAAQTYIYAAFAETPFKYATAALTPEVKQTVSVDYLIVAGGGGGGAVYGGGGGGAGGYLTNTFILNKSTSYTVTVGGGGNGVVDNEGNNGNSSSISGTGLTTVTATGGGGGGKYGDPIGTNGKNGGSGGGGGSSDDNGIAFYTTGGSASPSGQGSNGGKGGRVATPIGGGALGGGGGGGANSVGTDWSGSTAGNGGNGLASSITGTSVTRAAGGGGGAAGGAQGGTAGVAGTGKVGTDGDGKSGNSNGNNGTDFRGNGGGGGGQPSYAGGNGGKGVIIVRWLTSSANITLAGGAETGAVSYTDGSHSIREIRNSGTITFN